MAILCPQSHFVHARVCVRVCVCVCVCGCYPVICLPYHPFQECLFFLATHLSLAFSQLSPHNHLTTNHCSLHSHMYVKLTYHKTPVLLFNQSPRTFSRCSPIVPAVLSGAALTQFSAFPDKNRLPLGSHCLQNKNNHRFIWIKSTFISGYGASEAQMEFWGSACTGDGCTEN